MSLGDWGRLQSWQIVGALKAVVQALRPVPKDFAAHQFANRHVSKFRLRSALIPSALRVSLRRSIRWLQYGTQSVNGWLPKSTSMGNFQTQRDRGGEDPHNAWGNLCT